MKDKIPGIKPRKNMPPDIEGKNDRTHPKFKKHKPPGGWPSNHPHERGEPYHKTIDRPEPDYDDDRKFKPMPDKAPRKKPGMSGDLDIEANAEKISKEAKEAKEREEKEWLEWKEFKKNFDPRDHKYKLKEGELRGNGMPSWTRGHFTGCKGFHNGRPY